MKALKLIIFAFLFVAGQQAFGQNILVHNNQTFDVTADFNFKLPCGTTSTTTLATSASATGYTAGCGLLTIDVTFIDPTCPPPPTPVTFTINFTTNPTNYFYTLCNGQIVHFHIHFNGMDYIMDIN